LDENWIPRVDVLRKARGRFIVEVEIPAVGEGRYAHHGAEQPGGDPGDKKSTSLAIRSGYLRLEREFGASAVGGTPGHGAPGGGQRRSSERC